jgi:hypothetical protein
MTVKDILNEFSKSQKIPKDSVSRDDEKKEQDEIASRLKRLNKCFVEVILPAIFDVENDLNQAGYWNQLNIGQTTSPETGKPNIKAASIFFYPEQTESFSYEPQKIDATYKAHIAASGNLREIIFSIQFPKRIPPMVEIDDVIMAVEDIDVANVNGFLERYIMGALDAYNSDRILR